MIARHLFDLPATGWGQPFAEIQRLSQQMDRMTNAFFGGRVPGFAQTRVFPAVNITENGDTYYVRAELPGMTADDIELQVTNGNLVISGERKILSEGEKVRYHRREREDGTFSRLIRLPGAIDADKIEAKMTNGVLTVAVAKPEKAKPKQITIN